jgi:glycosyltransferase A (GT-A) superfamily protein (DUF2064 family)
MTCGLAIFVKTPGLSPVKTRLWPALGQRDAEALHLLSAEAVASVAEIAARDGDIAPHWAIAEDAAIGGDAWSDLPHLGQGEGGLGERMAHVYGRLTERFGAALLIGADAPQLQAGDLLTAARWLASGERRLTLGRAADGGFWLVGGNVPLGQHLWSRVQYSLSTTADDFIASAGAAGRWLMQRRLDDLDTPADLAPVLDALIDLPVPTDAQQRLTGWLAERASRSAAPGRSAFTPALQTLRGIPDA